MGKVLRRGVAGVAVVVAVVLASASPAFAHFCRRTDFNEVAAAHAGGSRAWLTADEWRAFLPFIANECPDAIPALEAILNSADEHTLFMGPGLLAGGTLFNGKGKTPSHFAYMHEAFSVCE